MRANGIPLLMWALVSLCLFSDCGGSSSTNTNTTDTDSTDNPCVTIDCGRGSCIQDAGNGLCECEPGWSGDGCDQCAAGYRSVDSECVPDNPTNADSPSDPDSPPNNDSGNFVWEDAIMYAVMIDRFFDGNPQNNLAVPGVDNSVQYQGGDFTGIEAKLDYLLDLGINTILLSAPYDNRDTAGTAGDPNTDPHMYTGYHGNWPSPDDIDYTELDAPSPLPAVESRLGTNAELHSLIAAAHTRGLYVLFDYVVNHVDIDSGLYQAHPDWFVEDSGSFRLCHQGAWDDPYWKTRCAFADYLPPLDFYNPDVLTWSIADAIWWARTYKVDGFRLDAIDFVPMAWLSEFRAALKAGLHSPTSGRFYLLGQIFELDNRDNIKAFIEPDTMLDGQLDYPLRQKISAALFSHTSDLSQLFSWMDGNDVYYPADSVMTTWIGNRDLPRAIHFASGQITGWPRGDSIALGWNPQSFQQPIEAAPYERLGLAYGILMTCRGAPLIYYGDEIGLAGGGTPDNHRMMTFDDSNLNARQIELRDLVKKLIRIRKENVALRRGRRETVTSGTDTFLYKMTGSSDNDVIYVLINRSDGMASVEGLPDGDYYELINETPLKGGGHVEVPQRSLLIAKPT